MKILDLVDTSRNGTAHLRDVGELMVPAYNGTVPLTRAVSIEDNNGATGGSAPITYVSFPDSGGIKIRRDVNCRNTVTAFTSGLGYLLDNLDPGLSDRLTPLILTYSQTFLELPVQWVSALNDLSIVLVNDQGSQTFLRLGYLGAIVGVGAKIKREVVVDRKRRSVAWYAKHPVTGVVTKSVTSYAAYTTMRFGGIVIGLAGRQDAPANAGLIYNYKYSALIEDVLFTESDLPTDPPRHGNFELATLSDVVNSSHANAAVLNTPRKVPKNVVDRYTGGSPVPVTGSAPVAFTLRPTLLSDAATTGKGKCVAVVVTADLKNTAGKQVCKAAVQDGRSVVFRTPRTHPFQQSQGMPGIGATVAQIDIKKPNGDIDASSLTKTITLSVN